MNLINLEFLSWKEIYEEESNSKFVFNFNKKVKTKTGISTTRTYYSCNRSGNRPSEARERRQKKSGLRTIGGFCPAKLILEKFSDYYHLTFCKTHVHENINIKKNI